MPPSTTPGVKVKIKNSERSRKPSTGDVSVRRLRRKGVVGWTNLDKESTHCHGEQRAPLGRKQHTASKERARNSEKDLKPAENKPRTGLRAPGATEAGPSTPQGILGTGSEQRSISPPTGRVEHRDWGPKDRAGFAKANV